MLQQKRALVLAFKSGRSITELCRHIDSKDCWCAAIEQAIRDFMLGKFSLKPTRGGRK